MVTWPSASPDAPRERLLLSAALILAPNPDSAPLMPWPRPLFHAPPRTRLYPRPLTGLKPRLLSVSGPPPLGTAPLPSRLLSNAAAPPSYGARGERGFRAPAAEFRAPLPGDAWAALLSLAGGRWSAWRAGWDGWGRSRARLPNPRPPPCDGLDSLGAAAGPQVLVPGLRQGPRGLAVGSRRCTLHPAINSLFWPLTALGCLESRELKECRVSSQLPLHSSF